MRFLLSLGMLFCYGSFCSQTTAELKKKFNTYLSFNGSLNSLVSFNEHSVSILKAGAAEFTAYTDELPKLSLLLKAKKPEDVLAIYAWKKNTHLSQKQLDSLLEGQNLSTVYAYKQPALKGKKIAIDPGHFAGDMQTARIEQKFIDFAPSEPNALGSIFF